MTKRAEQIPDDEIDFDLGEGRTRRLSDKILAAFNHAYATGELEVAKQLHRALKTNQGKGCDGEDKRQSYDPVGQAELWIAFVEARDRYKALCDGKKGAAQEALDALEQMKEAYRRWSFS